MRSRLRGAVALAATGVSMLLPAAATAVEQSATIKAGFAPYRLGGHTAMSLGFQIHTADGSLPSALTGLTFRYPRSLGLAASGLGLASCNPRRLQFAGPTACPPNSIMGHGQALAKFQVSPVISEERAKIAIVAGPPQHGYVQMLVAASGVYPVDARIIMPSLVLPGRLRFHVPLVPGVPEGPDVAVVRVHATVGGHLTYYKRRQGRLVRYHPQGILLPRRCPRGGFRFSATFSFLDDERSIAHTTVPCPRQSHRHRTGPAKDRQRMDRSGRNPLHRSSLTRLRTLQGL